MLNFFRPSKKHIKLPFLVDIHSHLLPGLDDGVKSIQETIYILKIFQKLGYKKVITTPHVMSDHYPNSSLDIISRLEVVKKEIKKHDIEIELEAAAEYYLDEYFISTLSQQKKFLTFGNNYLLFETSFFNKPAFLEDAIFNMNAQGYQPILAHPERYGYLQQDFKLLEKLKNMNLMFQLNLLSLTGFYSNDVRKFALKLLKSNLINFVGTDCHNALQANEILSKMTSKSVKLITSKNILNPMLITL